MTKRLLPKFIYNENIYFSKIVNETLVLLTVDKTEFFLYLIHTRIKNRAAVQQPWLGTRSYTIFKRTLQKLILTSKQFATGIFVAVQIKD